MRKDIFVVGVRLLGTWFIVGSILPLVTITSEYFGYIHLGEYGHASNILHFCVDFIVGAFLILRTHNIFRLIELLKVDDDKDQNDNNDVNEEQSEIK
jgi:hypothetical protein